MDVIKVKENIEKFISELDTAKRQLKPRSEEKAKTIADYDKALALTIIKLKNGWELELDGIKVKDVPATLIEKIAKGICFQERLALEKAEAEYKTMITYLSTTEAQLNGYQSINKHLD